jgi:hypothetical protein
MIERDLRLGLEPDIRRNMRLAQTFAVARPLLRQVRRYATGRLAWPLASDNDTAT